MSHKLSTPVTQRPLTCAQSLVDNFDALLYAETDYRSGSAATIAYLLLKVFNQRRLGTGPA